MNIEDKREIKSEEILNTQMKKYLFPVLSLFTIILSGCGEIISDHKNIEEENNEIIATSEEGITWISPEEIPSLHFFLKYDEENWDPNNEQYYFEDKTQYYKVGRIENGKYKNSEILLVISQPYLPSNFASVFRFVKKDNQFIFLDKYSDEISSNTFLEKNIILEAPQDLIDLLKEDFDIPKEITFNNVKLTLNTQAPVFFSEKNLVPVKIENKDFSYLNGNLFIEKNGKNNWTESDERIFQSNGFFLKLADNTTALYSMHIPFYSENEDENKYVPEIKWKNGKNNESIYTVNEGNSCGYKKGTFANVAQNKITISSYLKEDAIASGFPDAYESIIDIPFSDDDLEIVGSGINGEKIYSFKDKNHPVLKGFYEKNYSIEFQNVNDGIVIPYEDYVEKIPFFFWDDPFKRKLIFVNTEFYLSPACGAKPVIYLYPEETKEIEIKVNSPQKLFTSYPEYYNGWKVVSDTESNIFDIHSKVHVPYLFWEDLLVYDPPNQGFVIKKEEVSHFLDEKLTIIGLNEKEINDFKDFWLPKMQKKQYYFVTFLQTEEMNSLVPLEVLPKPNNIIRVFMHFRELDNKIEVEPLPLHQHKRDGFTVVEWGGELE